MTDRRRTWIGEFEWITDRIRDAWCDQNPNRGAQMYALLDYASKVGIARRSREPIPERPDLENAR